MIKKGIDYLKKNRNQIRESIFTILSIIFALAGGVAFNAYGNGYLERLPIITILIAATALYFSVMSNALNLVGELSKVWTKIRDAANKLGEEKDTFLESAHEALDACSNIQGSLKKNLNGQIFMIFIVLVSALVNEFIKTCFVDVELACIIMGSLNNAVILYSIGHTLYIIKDTSDVIFFVKKEIN